MSRYARMATLVRTEAGVIEMKFLIKGNYSPAGAQGLLTEGGSSRLEIVTKMIEGAGGSVEAFYFAFGETDVYAIVDMPDAATMTALALTISASGAVSVTTTPLITAAEVDEAAKKAIDYRPPGS